MYIIETILSSLIKICLLLHTYCCGGGSSCWEDGGAAAFVVTEVCGAVVRRALA